MTNPADVNELELFQSITEGRLARLERTRHEIVYLNPGLNGYQHVDTDTGWFLVSLRDVEPYLDGYKLNLTIGNPSNILYNGLALTFRRGKETQTIDVYTDFERGMWTDITVPLVPCTAAEVKALRLSIATKTFSLLKPKP